MTFWGFYLCCVIINIIICVPTLAISESDYDWFKNGLKYVTIKDIFIFIGLGLIPLYNILQAAGSLFYVIASVLVEIGINLFNMDFWYICPFDKKEMAERKKKRMEKNEKENKKTTHFEKAINNICDMYDNMY